MFALVDAFRLFQAQFRRQLALSLAIAVDCKHQVTVILGKCRKGSVEGVEDGFLLEKGSNIAVIGWFIARFRTVAIIILPEEHFHF